MLRGLLACAFAFSPTKLAHVAKRVVVVQMVQPQRHALSAFAPPKLARVAKRVAVVQMVQPQRREDGNRSALASVARVCRMLLEILFVVVPPFGLIFLLLAMLSSESKYTLFLWLPLAWATLAVLADFLLRYLMWAEEETKANT